MDAGDPPVWSVSKAPAPSRAVRRSPPPCAPQNGVRVALGVLLLSTIGLLVTNYAQQRGIWSVAGALPCLGRARRRPRSLPPPGARHQHAGPCRAPAHAGSSRRRPLGLCPNPLERPPAHSPPSLQGVSVCRGHRQRAAGWARAPPRPLTRAARAQAAASSALKAQKDARAGRGLAKARHQRRHPHLATGRARARRPTLSAPASRTRNKPSGAPSPSSSSRRPWSAAWRAPASSAPSAPSRVRLDTCAPACQGWSRGRFSGAWPRTPAVVIPMEAPAHFACQ
jgi:hypothetical protein